MTTAAAPGPVVGAARWREVIDHAGERCECRGGCGRKHADGRGRCMRMNDPPRAPLHAVPCDGTAPFHAAAALDASALHALCDPCHAAAAAMRARTRRAAAGALSAAETLF